MEYYGAVREYLMILKHINDTVKWNVVNIIYFILFSTYICLKWKKKTGTKTSCGRIMQNFSILHAYLQFLNFQYKHIVLTL